jgi:hypothetical protein
VVLTASPGCTLFWLAKVEKQTTSRRIFCYF